MSKDIKKQYKVYIHQHYKPITIRANSKEDAEHEVRNNYVWGEPIDVNILAVGKFELSSVKTEGELVSTSTDKAETKMKIPTSLKDIIKPNLYDSLSPMDKLKFLQIYVQQNKQTSRTQHEEILKLTEKEFLCEDTCQK